MQYHSQQVSGAYGGSPLIMTNGQDMQCVKDCDNPDKSKREYFEQPVWQTLNMFVGETFCLIATYVVMIWQAFGSNRKIVSVAYTPLEVNDSGVVLEDEDSPVNKKPLKIIVDGKERSIMQGYQAAYFWIPAVFDITATTLMNIGLLYTSASIYQMCRGALVIWVGLLSIMFLGRRLKLYEWFALILVTLGVAIVGLSGILFRSVKSPVETDATEEDTIAVSEAARTAFGIIIVLLAQIFTASQFVVEEKIMEHFAIEPLLAVGYEGIFGLLTTLIGMLILWVLFGHDGNYFDLQEGYRQFTEYPQVWGTGIAIAFSIAFFNFFGLSVTRNVSATARSTIDTCRTLFIWLVSLYLGWESFAWLQVVGFVVLVYGTFIYTKVIKPPRFCAGRSGEATPLLVEDPEPLSNV